MAEAQAIGKGGDGTNATITALLQLAQDQARAGTLTANSNADTAPASFTATPTPLTLPTSAPTLASTPSIMASPTLPHTEAVAQKPPNYIKWIALGCGGGILACIATTGIIGVAYMLANYAR